MCGIFAVFENVNAVNRRKVEEATNTLAHRGPDNAGVAIFAVPTNNGTVFAGFGHRRLAIIDLDPRANQPFSDADAVLVFNGEIYNFQEQTFLAGYPLKTTSDTEVLHHGLRLHGDAILNRFTGMWAFCFLDKASNIVTLSRDRYGKKPLFYYRDNQVLCVASEMKAITTYLGRRFEMDHAKIENYIAFGMSYPDPTGKSFYQGIQEVAPGQTLKLDLATWQVQQRHWHNFEIEAHRPPGDLVSNFENAVTSRLLSERPVGLLLSGGVDSSIILSVLMARGLQDRVHCFIGETGAEISEDASYARQCAAAAGVTAQEVRCDYGSAAFDNVLKMCAHHEKPFPLTGNSMAMYEMYSHIAESDVRVVIDGTGGDEVFGGYWDRYSFFAIRDAMRAGDTAWLSQAISAAENDPQLSYHLTMGLKRVAGEQMPTVAQGHATHYGLDGVRKAIFADPLDLHKGDLASAMIVDAVSGRLPEWIWHNDRNAMAFGIENRSPFLDCSLIPMVGQHYSEKFYRAWNKYALRKLYDAFAPLPTQWRVQKQGFRWPNVLFLRENKARVLELIAGSQVLNEHVALNQFLDDAGANDNIAFTDFTARLCCIAGIEQTR
ncbi:asparagine synthase (glutamine-hydrolyzing) [Ensifer adhaerens]|uniref:asparagine synthase (glutamine-hydrolyzing) n=1 Tax=Ensifer adhaerens TaxID=106592 RepID=UPI00080732D1|nr:asparagine synthase (glutamine-hydrolyzing) [Ensifer adhaerens]